MRDADVELSAGDATRALERFFSERCRRFGSFGSGDGMRTISFALTTEQVRNQTKTVTRRHGWLFLKIGDLLQPVVKGQGIPKGGRVERIGGPIRVVSVRREPLWRLVADLTYGCDEVRREGFEHARPVQGSPLAFVEFYQNATPASARPSIDDDVTRIEFEYVEPIR